MTTNRHVNRRASQNNRKLANKNQPAELSIRAGRAAAFEGGLNNQLQDFCNKMGRAVNGAGKMRSLGSITISLLTESNHKLSRSKLSSRDRSRLRSTIVDFHYGLNESLRERPDEISLALEGLSLWGRNIKRQRPGSIATVAFNIDTQRSKDLCDDIDTIKSYYEDNGVPSPNISLEKMHLSVGDVRVGEIIAGMNKKSHLIVPSGIIIPQNATMSRAEAEIV